ncbi:MAG: ankyrin repeat domain-containing protein [Solirubrobacteraceae bacterium]
MERSTPASRLIAACLIDDEAEARAILSADRELASRLTETLRIPILRAAETDSSAAVGLMLELGFPIQEPVGEDGGTLLHVAAYSGAAETVRLLLDRGAAVTARDLRWESMPLEWGCIGSGEKPDDVPAPNWPAVVRMMIDAGSPLDEVSPSFDQPKPPSPEIAELLRNHGVT